MEFIGLKRKYVSVDYGGTVTYGGTQMRCWNEGMKKSGCGLIAAADLFLYLQGKTFAPMAGEDYNRYLKSLLPGYFQVIPPFGMTSLTLCVGSELYFRRHDMPYTALWLPHGKKTFERVYDMLARDVPVILCIGQNVPLFWQKNKVTFYRKTAEGLYVGACSTKAHFVTITGMDGMWLRISSWGKEYYVNQMELENYFRDYAGPVSTGILAVKERER